MEEESKELSIWHRDLNLVFVYGVILLSGIAIVSIMINILNSKVSEISEGVYQNSGYVENTNNM